MKIKLIVFAIIIIFIGAYGWRFYKDAIDAYKYNKSCEEHSAQLNIDLDTISQELKTVLLTYEEDFNCPKEGAYYDFCKQFIDAGYTINKITAKKLAGNSNTTIVSYNSVDDTHNINNADLLEIVFTVEDNEVFMDYLDKCNYAVDKLIIYPSDNAIVVTFVVGGAEL